MTLRRTARAVALAAACLFLASCRVDTNVALHVQGNGSGRVVVTVTADEAVVKAAPGLAADVRNDDLTAAGWRTIGPEETEDGGLTVTFERAFDNPEQATAVLAQVNDTRGPLRQLALVREGKESNSTFTLSGRLEVNGGLEAFADDAALKLLGGAPYAAQVSSTGKDLGKILGITFEAHMPGTVRSTTGSRAEGVISWRVPTDGTPTDVATVTNNVDIAANVARVAKWAVALLFLLWVGASLVLAAMVAARRRGSPRP
ncbi:MAG: hypothetical protein ACKOBO_03390 [Acidimicrobiales bacterium]